MSAKQAEVFAATYSVIAQIQDPTGFSATIFEKGGVRYFAIRGTEGTFFAGALDWLTNVQDIGANGIAVRQGIAMFNWLQRLIGVSGNDVVQYEYHPGRIDGDTGLYISPSLTTYTATATGELNGQTAPMTVAGHSLGGQLAMMLSRLVPGMVSSVYTYNAPGFDTVLGSASNPLMSEGFFNLLRNAPIGPLTGAIGTGWNSSLMTHLDVEGDIVHSIGNTPGTQQIIFSESANQGPYDAHLVDPITDSLAIYDLIARLDPTRSNTPAGVAAITDVLKASASLASKSLENAIDAVRKIVLGTNPTPTPQGDRDTFYKNYFALKDSASFLALAGNAELRSLVGKTQDDLKGLANATGPDGLAYRYALNELNPFAILGANYTAHNTNGNLNLYDPSARTGTLTDEWVKDRSAFLVNKIAANTIDNEFSGKPWVQYSGQPQHFQDLTDPKPYDLYTGENNAVVQLSPSLMTNILFGGSRPDYLVGGVLSDKLYGNAGNDFITGGKGDDYIEGGYGEDIYAYYAGDGKDTILDTDGFGRIIYYAADGRAHLLTGGHQTAEGSNTYQSRTQPNVQYRRETNGNLTLILDGVEAITVKNPRLGDLGITLEDESSTLTTLPVTTPWGTAPTNIPTEPYVITRISTYDSAGTLIGQTQDPPGFPADRISVGTSGFESTLITEPNTYPATYREVTTYELRGQLSVMTDTDLGSVLSADTATTALYGMGGADTIDGRYVRGVHLYGGSGDDTLNGGKIYNDNYQTLGQAAFEVQYGAIKSGVIGVYADGETGNDELTGTLYDDTLTGGDGHDYIQGGRGEDVISGNTGNDWIDAGADRDDVNGDDGEDWLMGGGGSDTVQGGAGNDRLWGDAGIKTYLNTLARWNGTLALPFGDFAGAAGDFFLLADVPLAQAGDDVLDGGAGDDKIYGGAGDDLLIGGAGLDDLLGEGGDDILFGGDDNDRLWGDNAINSVAVDQDPIPGDYGYYVWRMRQRDVGPDGDDYLDAGAGDDLLYGGGGNDHLLGGTGSDSLYGGLANASVSGDDTLEGGNDNDFLFGEDGNDSLRGDAGDDQLSGGAGDDTYIFARGDGADVIFDDAGNDTLVLDGINADEVALNHSRGRDLVIGVPGTGDTLTLANWAINAGSRIESIEFADGTLWDTQEIMRRSGGVIVNAGDNVIDATGESGNYTANFGPGLANGFSASLQDSGGIDGLRFEPVVLANTPLTPSGAYLIPTLAGMHRDGNDLVLDLLLHPEVVIPEVQGQMRIKDQFTAAGRIESISGLRLITQTPDGQAVYVSEETAAQVQGAYIQNVESGATYLPYVTTSTYQGITAVLQTGTNDDDVLNGLAAISGSTNRVFYGWEGNDTLIGGTRDDIFHGGSGNDRMEGGQGWDTYYINPSEADVIFDSALKCGLRSMPTPASVTTISSSNRSMNNICCKLHSMRRNLRRSSSSSYSLSLLAA